ncbi:DUF2288 domain-containing protein [Marinobacter sp. X15-166B]|uniref:DUF2288 domain-containing protein n=1 Tax=Marinobacter sp. X15-166B TaxID=1897620 RepID=UPI00085C165E|nr:DUF2288 domain-containing protein [Marinobacter sp. X15-166B]OEY65799.1 hypothetical protein BG841_04580 [Marinobacter sp. X15-166B]
MSSSQSTDELITKLNLETSKIGWRELQTYYARGHVVQVAPELDLLTVAVELVADNTAQFESWMATGKVGEVSADLARSWYDRDTELWAVVIAPWVLVQYQHDDPLH